MNGVYWGLTAMFLVGCEDKMDKDGVLEFVMKCYHQCGGKY
jgi:geranylgeranyl transferase type-2 subunit beta